MTGGKKKRNKNAGRNGKGKKRAKSTQLAKKLDLPRCIKPEDTKSALGYYYTARDEIEELIVADYHGAGTRWSSNESLARRRTSMQWITRVRSSNNVEMLAWLFLPAHLVGCDFTLSCLVGV
jgi:hypothetical protein